MISKDFIDTHNVINLWRVSKRDENLAVGFISAYVAEREDGKWLAVINDEVMEVNTRETAMYRVRKKGYWTRVGRVSTC